MKGGFTLIEMLVSITLFAVMVAIATGGFVSALRTQREVAGLISAQSNAGLALEQISREIRTGYLFCHDLSGGTTCHYAVGNPCTAVGGVSTCADLNFFNGESANVIYSLSGGELVRTDNNGPEPITGANVVVKNLSFIIFGNQEGDHWNPRITILLGIAPSSNDPAVANDVLNLETSVSSRNIDCLPAGGPGSC